MRLLSGIARIAGAMRVGCAAALGLSLVGSATALAAPVASYQQQVQPLPSNGNPWEAPAYTPAVVEHELQPLDEVPHNRMPALDYDAIEEEDFERELSRLPPRYAIPFAARIEVPQAGLWEHAAGAHSVLRYRISAPNAVSINLGFARYHLPLGGRMFIYPTGGDASLRAFTWLDNKEHGELWTPPVAGNDITIEVTVPTRLRHQLELTIGSINLGYRTFGEMIQRSGSCNVDVVCPEGEPWEKEIATVAVISTGGSTFCTGFMVNNVRQDRTPFFMTANHCGISSSNAASLVTFWNYENSTCRPPGSSASGGSGDGTLNQFNTGSTWLASLSTSDFTLVVLDDDPDPEWDVHFAGWDARDYDADWAVCIHHPNTDEKRISFEYDPVQQTIGFNNTNIVTSGGDHVLVHDWDLGTTEPGASGSPLFDGDTHRVIGQLHGGLAACGNDSWDSYGKFSFSWDRSGATTTNSLKPHLDPDNTGVLFVNTIGNGMRITPGGGGVHQGPVGGPFTNDPFAYTLINDLDVPTDYQVSLGTGDAPLTINGGSGAVNGTLSALGGSANINIGVAAAAGGLSSGTYSRQVIFEDVTNSITTIMTHTIEVGLVGFAISPNDDFVTGGPVGGPFATTRSYTITNTQPNPVDVEVASNQSWITVSGAARRSGGGNSTVVSLNGLGDSADVTIGIGAGAELLDAGIYDGVVTFTDLTGDGSSDASRNITLEIGRFIYAATGLPQPIPDEGGGPLISTITINEDFCTLDVDVEIKIDHTWIGDLRVVLEHNGTEVMIIDRPGHSGSGFGCSAENFDIVLDDEGTGGPIEVQCQDNLSSPPNYTPNEALSAFFGRPADGVWTLTVTDNAGQDTGSLISWSLRILGDPDCRPFAEPMTVIAPQDSQTEIVLSGHSPLGNAMSYIINTLPSRGSLSEAGHGTITTVPHALAGNSVFYTPDSGWNGPDNFSFRVADGQLSGPATVALFVGPPQVVHEWLLDTDPGWDREAAWNWGTPTGNQGDPSSGFTGANVFGYNLNGWYTNNMPERNLTTHAIDCSDLVGTTLSFHRWLGVESGTWDHAYVRVSNNGVDFVTIWENGSATINETSWSHHEYDISHLADGEETVYIRWVMGTTDGTVVYQGWNIDDIRILGYQIPSQIPGDVNGDCAVNVQDLLLVIANWGSDGSSGGDANDDGIVNVQDLLLVISNWGNTCP